ncbi:putative beta-glucosidase C [Sarocladium implicatum]|nr:putative beta-glucosidase C [Sarocladium implicatum]
MNRFLTYALASLAVSDLGQAAPSNQGDRASSLPRQFSNSTLPIYKNSTRCVDDRVDDLLSRMTLEEKAGQMFHNSLTLGTNFTFPQSSRDPNAPNGRYGIKELIVDNYMSHFNVRGAVDDPAAAAEWINSVQELARETRLGIPISISSDPRHHYSQFEGATIGSGGFSRFPETIGMAAIRDAALVRQMADIAREEYVAVGIRGALHPQVDLSTEPRWARIYGAWGEDAHLTSEMIVEYIKGFQGESIGPYSVTTVTKHFPGGGAMQNGEDSHFPNGKNQTYPGNNLDYHLIPFRAAFEAGARQIMPYYSRPIGTQWEEVGFSFNKGIVTGLLRNEMGFDGIVVTDWGLITDTVMGDLPWPARAWGLEDASEEERAFRVLDAGCDQFGGENRFQLIIDLVRSGRIPEERLDLSVRKLLKEKFLLGLFDNPFADPEAANAVVGNPYFVRVGEMAQRRSFTLLTNEENRLPLRNLPTETRIYVEGVNASLVEDRGFTVVETPEEAQLAFLRLQGPYDPRNGTLEGNFGYQQGTLEFDDDEKARQAKVFASVPSIVDVHIVRPVAFPEIAESAAAVMVSYGSSDDAFLDVVLGVAEPEGQLPFDLLRSDEAAEEQMEDVPFDSKDPLFRFGHGLRYKGLCEGADGARKC